MNCPICTEKYSTENKPHCTTCGHMFCQNCIKKLSVCPICRNLNSKWFTPVVFDYLNLIEETDKTIKKISSISFLIEKISQLLLNDSDEIYSFDIFDEIDRIGLLICYPIFNYYTFPLLEKKLQSKNCKNYSNLMLCAQYNNLEIAKYLLTNDCDVNYQADITALIIACKNGYFEMTKLLLENGAKCNCFSELTFETPLMYNVTGKINKEIIQILIEYGVNLNATNLKGNTVLFMVNEKEILELLVKNGLDPDIRNLAGETACSWIVRNGMVPDDYFIEITDLDIQDNAGRTVLMKGIMKDYREFVKKIIEKGVHFSRQDEEGRTALFYAITNYYDTNYFFDDLFCDGDEINIQDNNGQTVLHWVVNKCYENCENWNEDDVIFPVKILVENGADIGIFDKGGKTPMLLAIENCMEKKRFGVLNYLRMVEVERNKNKITNYKN